MRRKYVYGSTKGQKISKANQHDLFILQTRLRVNLRPVDTRYTGKEIKTMTCYLRRCHVWKDHHVFSRPFHVWKDHVFSRPCHVFSRPYHVFQDYTMLRQWCPRERPLGKTPGGLTASVGAIHLERPHQMSIHSFWGVFPGEIHPYPISGIPNRINWIAIPKFGEFK